MIIKVKYLFYICYVSVRFCFSKPKHIQSLIRDSFEISLNWVNFSVGSFIFITAIMQIALGTVIDHKSQKNVIISGLTLTCIATFVCAFTDNFPIFLLFRILQAIGTAVIPLVTINMIAKLFQDNARGNAMGTYQILLSLAPSAVPILGGFIGASYGYTGIFLFLFIISTTLLLCIIFTFPKDGAAKNKEVTSKSSPKKYKEVLSNHKGISTIVLGFLFFHLLWHAYILACTSHGPLPCFLTDSGFTLLASNS